MVVHKIDYTLRILRDREHPFFSELFLGQEKYRPVLLEAEAAGTSLYEGY